MVFLVTASETSKMTPMNRSLPKALKQDFPEMEHEVKAVAKPLIVKFLKENKGHPKTLPEISEAISKDLWNVVRPQFPRLSVTSGVYWEWVGEATEELINNGGTAIAHGYWIA